MNKSILVVSATGLAIAWGCLAAGLPMETTRDPAGQPLTSIAMAVPNDPLTTGSIPRASNIAPASTDLKAGLDALTNRKPLQAIAVRNGMARGTLDRHILTWAIATSGQTGIPSAEIASASQELGGWPGLASLRGYSERAIYNENPPTAEVLAAFGETAPETPEGAFALSKALIAVGKPAQAAAYIRNVWRNETLDASLEDKYLAAFAGLLTPVDHKARMDLLLYRSKTAQAKRFGDLGNAQSLYTAWAAVNDRSPKAAGLLANIAPQWKSDPAYLFMRIEFERRKENYDTAAALLAQMPRDRSLLIDASQWWDEQRIVSRGLVDEGNYKAAYRIADDNVAVTPLDVGEAEFHAGWYALRGLKDPATAATHFRKILDVSNGPISVSRAWYWLGRAAEAGGPGNASDFYAKAAALPSTFYGQLAARKLGRQMLDVSYPSPSPDDRQRFQSREAVLAIARLEAAGNGWRADSLYRGLAQQLQSPGEIALLAASAERSGNHQLSLQVGKIAYGRGVDVAALAFPIGVIPDDANITGSGKALAYAIARQESAFNPQAVSSADARGLLQLLPKTAKAVAGRHGIVYSADRLTKDAGYNATLGSHYLGEQIDAFSGSYILTFVAYNAGPKKVPVWISRYGDPRGKSMDEVVDWIERIPFPETRNYVQRVMENYEVYKARLGQKSDIEQDLIHGRG